jgi:mono/diheme cytochrome c family protein
MTYLNKIRMLAFIIIIGLFFAGCMTHHADDLSRQRPVDTHQRLTAVPSLAGKLATDAHEQLTHPEKSVLSGAADRHSIQRGNALFHGKAGCYECHGENGDLSRISHSQGALLDPPPTDLRIPTEKSVRQLFLSIKYGIPATGMVPRQRMATLPEEDILAVIAYLLDLQGSARPPDVIASQKGRPHTETDVAIAKMCEQEEIGNVDTKARCEDRYAKRYLDLIVGRPPDISAERYAEIEIRCKQRAMEDLDTLMLCYRAEYVASRPETRRVDPD